MTLKELFQRVKALGVVIEYQDKGKLSAKPANKLTPEILAALKEHRDLILSVFAVKIVRDALAQTNGRIVDIADTIEELEIP